MSIIIILNLIIQVSTNFKINLYLIANETINSISINSKTYNPQKEIFPKLYNLEYESNPGEEIIISMKPSIEKKCKFNGAIKLSKNEKVYFEEFNLWNNNYNYSYEFYDINGNNISLFIIEAIENYCNFTYIIPINYVCQNYSFNNLFLNQEYKLNTRDYISDIYEGNFDSTDSLFIIFKNISDSIILYDEKEEKINENKEYPLKIYKYKFINSGLINVTFTGKSKTEIEKSNKNYYFEFKVCYKTCKSCNEESKDEYNQKCKECINNYYKKENDSFNNCYNETPGQNYFLDTSSSPNIYRKCDDNCSSCLNKSYCLSCLNGTYIVEKTHNCISINDKPANTFFDNLTNTIIECYSYCTCENKGNEYNHSCIKCLDNYSNTEDNLYNCYNNNETIENYFFNGSLFKRCYQLCKTCYTSGNIYNNSCNECIDYHYFIYDDNLIYNCIEEGTQPINYYLNDNDTYLKCYNNCLSCSNGGNRENNNCSRCIDNYILITGNEKQNCENLEEINNNDITLNNLLPLYNDNFESFYSFKIVLIRNESFYFYYSPSLINYNEYLIYPFIILGIQCQRNLKSKYNYEKLIFAENVNQSNLTNFTFHLFLNNNEINLTEECNNHSFIKQFPINKTKIDKNLLSQILLSKDLNNLILIINNLDIFNSSSEFYLNPCLSFIINNKEIELNERQNMFLNELNLCPENCTLESFDLLLRIIKCKCYFNDSYYHINNNKIIEKNIFSKKEFEIYGLSIFSCYQIFYSFPKFENIFFHYILLIIEIIIILLFSYFWFFEMKKIKKYLYSNFFSKANPPKEISFNLGNDSFDNIIELKTFSRSENQNNDSLISSNNSNFTFQMNNSSIKNETIIDFKKESIEIFYKKLFIISLFNSYSKNSIVFPFSLKISENLFLLSFISFSSSFSIDKDSKYSINTFRNYSVIIITIILSCLLQQIIFYLMKQEKIYKVGKNKKNIIIKFVKNLQIKTSIFYIIFIFFGLIFWYFTYIFCVIHKDYQIICFINFGIRFLGILIFDFIINIIIIYYSKKNSSSL